MGHIKSIGEILKQQMNLAFFLTPKDSVAYLYDDMSVRRAIEKMKGFGYTSVPVVTRENKYLGTVSEGDFLWFLLGRSPRMDINNADGATVRDVVKAGSNPPVRITATLDELVDHAVNQNFVPVLDDLDGFIGIVTRKNIIGHYCRESRE